MTRKRLLVVASGGQKFREYALESISRRADVILLDRHPLSWQAPYLVDFQQVDVEDQDALVRVGRRVRPDGVLTYDESLVEIVANVAVILGLDGPHPAAIRLCKDKSALRARLAEAGLAPVRFAVATTLGEAVAAGVTIGYPVVLKPRALGGSIGVVRADNEEQLRAGYHVAATARAGEGTVSRLPGVLIEEYLDGDEFSIDSVTWQGVTHTLIQAEKVLAFPPYFEEHAHIVPATPRPELDEAAELVAAAHRIAGLDQLVTHSEVRLTSRGPRLIEINVRLGGDLIPLLGRLATGLDLAAMAADVAVGVAPALTVTRNDVAAISIFYPQFALRLKDVHLRNEPGTYPGLDRFITFLPPGTELRLPPEAFMSRVGFAIVTAGNREECLRRLQAVEQDVVIDGEPLVAT